MATKITFKKPNLKARNVSHANNKSNRTQKLNMQKLNFMFQKELTFVV